MVTNSSAAVGCTATVASKSAGPGTRRNIDEFIAGTDPNNREDCLDILSMTRTGSTLTATVPGTLPVGTFDLSVTAPDGQRGDLEAAFTVLPDTTRTTTWARESCS